MRVRIVKHENPEYNVLTGNIVNEINYLGEDSDAKDDSEKKFLVMTFNHATGKKLELELGKENLEPMRGKLEKAPDSDSETDSDLNDEMDFLLKSHRDETFEDTQEKEKASPA